MHKTGTLITGINFQQRKVSHVYWQKPLHACPTCNTRLIFSRNNKRSDELFCYKCNTYTYDPVSVLRRMVSLQKRYYDITHSVVVGNAVFEGKQSLHCQHHDCKGEVAISLNQTEPRWTINSVCLDCGQHYDAKVHKTTHSRQQDELGTTTAHMSDMFTQPLSRMA